VLAQTGEPGAFWIDFKLACVLFIRLPFYHVYFAGQAQNPDFSKKVKAKKRLPE
jgi:hypothetical protein